LRKLGLGLLITGVFGQLSALLWTYTFTGSICENNGDNSYIQQKATKFERVLEEAANKVATELSAIRSVGLAPLIENQSRVPDSAEAAAVQDLLEQPNEIPALELAFSSPQLNRWTIILSGLVAFGGLLLTVFARKQTTHPQWHVFRTLRGSLITLERPCLTCGGYVFHGKKVGSSKPSACLWVVEIALNTPSRHRATKAIEQLKLPVARRENNFAVIGPYKQKRDAARVVKELSEGHGVRGWLMAGN